MSFNIGRGFDINFKKFSLFLWKIKTDKFRVSLQSYQSDSAIFRVNFFIFSIFSMIFIFNHSREMKWWNKIKEKSLNVIRFLNSGLGIYICERCCGLKGKEFAEKIRKRVANSNSQLYACLTKYHSTQIVSCFSSLLLSTLEISRYSFKYFTKKHFISFGHFIYFLRPNIFFISWRNEQIFRSFMLVTRGRNKKKVNFDLIND